MHVGWIHELISNEYNMEEGWDITLESRLQKTLWLLSWTPFLLFSGPLWAKPVTMLWEAHIARCWCVWPTAREDLELDNSQVSQFGSRSSQVEPWEDNRPGLDCSLWQTLSQRYSAEPNPDSRNGQNKVCCLKLLNFEVICYATIDI